jgi:hypothetical protein
VLRGREGDHTAKDVLAAILHMPQDFEDLLPPETELARAAADKTPDEVWRLVQQGHEFEGAGMLTVKRLPPWKAHG